MKKANKISILEKLKLPLSRRFNNKTKVSDLSKYKKTPYSTWPEEWKKIYYKAYPRMEEIVLPVPDKKAWSLKKALRNRESKRNFTSKAISTSNLSDLLFFSGGLKELLFKSNGNRRFYPSAGARYPLEIYPIVFRSDKLKPAIYHYHVKRHSLEKLYDKGVIRKTLKQFDQPWIRKSSLLIVVSAVFDRTEKKYSDRGLRHIYTEYGHFAQNVSLISTELGLGACSIGGFVDDGLNRLIDLDWIDESVVGVIAIGTI